jgi:hypothetical protein
VISGRAAAAGVGGVFMDRTLGIIALAFSKPFDDLEL